MGIPRCDLGCTTKLLHTFSRKGTHHHSVASGGRLTLSRYIDSTYFNTDGAKKVITTKNKEVIATKK
jgi:hypothetical protein